MPMYSDKVMEHFMRPRNVGEIENADGVGEIGNPTCGDMMTFMITVEDDKLVDIKFKTFGCGAAIAVSSMVSEMGTGKTLDEAMEITNDMVAEELGGLPKNKMHCSNLGADALHAAIEDYRKRKETGEPAPKPLAQKSEMHGQTCPYCDSDVDEKSLPFCASCKTELSDCPECGKVVSGSLKECPHCGCTLGDEEKKD
jgi:nitrogen fixation NifU-like protein